MCVFRVGNAPFGQSWSSDEGRTWSEPVAMKFGTVEPRMLAQQSGTVILTGGRPGLYLYFNRDGSGKEWQPVDTLTHHNAFLPQEPIATDYALSAQSTGGTSAYTGIIPIDANTFLYTYDRVPVSFKVRTGWKADPKDANNVRETFGIYVVRVTVERK